MVELFPIQNAYANRGGQIAFQQKLDAAAKTHPKELKAHAETVEADIQTKLLEAANGDSPSKKTTIEFSLDHSSWEAVGGHNAEAHDTSSYFFYALHRKLVRDNPNLEFGSPKLSEMTVSGEHPHEGFLTFRTGATMRFSVEWS